MSQFGSWGSTKLLRDIKIIGYISIWEIIAKWKACAIASCRRMQWIELKDDACGLKPWDTYSKRIISRVQSSMRQTPTHLEPWISALMPRCVHDGISNKIRPVWLTLHSTASEGLVRLSFTIWYRYRQQNVIKELSHEALRSSTNPLLRPQNVRGLLMRWAQAILCLAQPNWVYDRILEDNGFSFALAHLLSVYC